MSNTNETRTNEFNAQTVPSGSTRITDAEVIAARQAELSAAQERGLPVDVYRKGYDMKSMG